MCGEEIGGQPLLPADGRLKVGGRGVPGRVPPHSPKVVRVGNARLSLIRRELEFKKYIFECTMLRTTFPTGRREKRALSLAFLLLANDVEVRVWISSAAVRFLQIHR